jgi:hypothetical protein
VNDKLEKDLEGSGRDLILRHNPGYSLLEEVVYIIATGF